MKESWGQECTHAVSSKRRSGWGVIGSGREVKGDVGCRALLQHGLRGEMNNSLSRKVDGELGLEELMVKLCQSWKAVFVNRDGNRPPILDKMTWKQEACLEKANEYRLDEAVNEPLVRRKGIKENKNGKEHPMFEYQLKWKRKTEARLG